MEISEIIQNIQGILGLVIAFYVFKALLGKFSDGDGLKLIVAAVLFFILLLFSSGFIEIHFEG